MPNNLLYFIWRHSARQQVLLCILSASVFLLTAVPLELQRRIVNMVTEEGTLATLVVLCGLYFLVVLAQGGLKYAMNILRGRVGEQAVRSLRSRIRRGTGVTGAEGTEVSMVSGEVEPVGGFVGESLSVPVVNAGILLTVLGYMLVVQPLMAVVGLAVFLPQTIVVPYVQRRVNVRARQRIEMLRDIGDDIVEEAGEREDGGSDDHEEQFETIYRLRMGIFRLKFRMKFLINFMNHMATLGTLFIGGWLVLRGETQIGTVVAFISGFERLNTPWRELIAYFRTASDARVKYRLIRDALTA